MSSQQLVRRLLRATDNAAPPAPTTKRSSASTTAVPRSGKNVVQSHPSRRPPTKRQRRKYDAEDSTTATSLTEQEALDWHVQTRLLNVDRQMAARGSRNSNSRAVDQSLQRLMETNATKKRASDLVAVQSAKVGVIHSGGRGLPPRHRPKPTFNKKRHEDAKKRKKMDQLKKALKSLEKDKKKAKAKQNASSS